jgi:hypothetical protein
MKSFPLMGILLSTVALAEERVDFATIVKQTGCGSNRDGAVIFDSRYKDRLMIAAGEIVDIHNGSIGLKLLPTTRTYDVRVKLGMTSEAERLRIGQHITISFMMRRPGTCWWGYIADEGHIHKD